MRCPLAWVSVLRIPILLRRCDAGPFPGLPREEGISCGVKHPAGSGLPVADREPSNVRKFVLYSLANPEAGFGECPCRSTADRRSLCIFKESL